MLTSRIRVSMRASRAVEIVSVTPAEFAAKTLRRKAVAMAPCSGDNAIRPLVLNIVNPAVAGANVYSG